MIEKVEEKQSTKYCPKCGTEHLLLLRSMNKKICVDCRIEIPWYLDKGQLPLLCASR